ncbi:hypothetical protein PhCBS80983_g02507 [Powellomyces hirtus]|uniref:LIM zinc-binding domain-containing protein n=1 Tax=Powellomyces hirtus TaxID=109895 RepID=A0A507E5K7_9FUNG|nr:hypothetical protein DFJ77DRAFT_545792 [Powellomyces hirtus]TPX59359.1 hypothetical protein PhCBS80983_g02507 [Powellomyces hirtus]
MSSSEKCGKCEKTVYPTEKVEAASKWYHKGCFKCSDQNCNIQLNLKTFQVVNEQIWCQKHAPQPKATAVADAVSVMHAKHAPKKASEGLHKTTVGTGETPSYGLDTLGTQHALLVPRKSAENLGTAQKGDRTREQARQGSNGSLNNSTGNLQEQENNADTEPVTHDEIQV